ncbi:MAG: hypothetical protein Q7R35_08710 [Elusimicrobiota bacterium]|nr:hypothetical protein [Elusimicrobiota bacterium]
MNDNLPEINFKEKKEKKGGALGWLRGRLGMGSRGAMGEAGINPAAMNVGRALGTAKFGASSAGLAGLLAGKGGMLALIAMVAVASGVYIANNAPAPATSNGAFNSGKTADNYVPAILRSQAANNGSSLDMFKESNRGAGLDMDGEAAKAAADKAAADKAAADKAAEDAAAAKNPEQPAAEGNAAQDMMGKLQGGSGASLTSSLGGGSGKFSGMGGFGNKFNQGATGAKTGFSSGIGAGFSGMPKFDQRKGKMLAMKAASRPVFGGSKAKGKGNFGKGAFNQAKGMRDVQKTYTGTSADGQRSTQDKAWEGTTGDGTAGSGGSGLSDGGAGVVTSPSLDNGGSGGGGGGGGTAPEVTAPEVPNATDDSPWKGLPEKAMMYIMLSLVLSAIASYLCSIKVPPWVYWVGVVFAVAALGAAGMAIAAAAQIMGHGQTMMGGLYMVGGVMALANAALSFAGNADFNAAMRIMGVMAGLAALIGSMLGGK